jgi:hypothetical protein
MPTFDQFGCFNFWYSIFLSETFFSHQMSILEELCLLLTHDIPHSDVNGLTLDGGKDKVNTEPSVSM